MLHGAPITTRDLDIVPRRTEENVDCLHKVLSRLHARIRDPAGRVLEPTRGSLAGGGQVLLSTTLGPLDCLGTLHDGRGYEELARTAVSVSDEATTIKVVDLPTLIEIKTRAARAKDRLVLPILIALQSREGEGRD